MEDKVRDEIEHAAASRAETVQDLINILRSFPPSTKLSFSPFNLHSVVASGDQVQFEISELEGVHFKMIENPNG